MADKFWEKKLYLLGTLRKNKPHIPEEFIKKAPLYSSKFGFNLYKTLVSYTQKVNKCVVLLSTKHHKIEVSNDEEKKPVIILDYNKNKGIDLKSLKHTRD